MSFSCLNKLLIFLSISHFQIYRFEKLKPKMLDFLDILNGPIMLIICLIGSILNFYAIYVLSVAVFPKQTFATVYVQNANFVRRHDSFENSALSQTTSHRESAITRKTNRRSRIFIYLLWLTACDSFLLICSIFNFSIPLIINDYGFVFMKSIPIW